MVAAAAAMMWTVSQGDQEYPAPEYRPPSVALLRAKSKSLVTHRSTHVKQLSNHAHLHLLDMHLLSGLYFNFMCFHTL